MIKSIAEAVKKALLPELEKLGARMDRMEGRLEELSQRVSDLNDHIVRLDQRLDQTNARIDQTNVRIDAVRSELLEQLGQTNARIDAVHQDLLKRMDELRRELVELIMSTRTELRAEIAKNTERIDQLNARLDQTNARIDQLDTRLSNRIDEVVLDLTKIHSALVRQEDYDRLREQVHELEKKVAALMR